MHHFRKSAILSVFIFFFLWGCGGKGNSRFESFNEVKEILLSKVYPDHRITFYCGCAFGKNKSVRCNAGGKKQRVEWEHIVPASRFGRTFKEWKKQESFPCRLPSFLRTVLFLKCRTRSARENARSLSQEYRRMESDMHNLVPAVGGVNRRRSDRDFGEIPGEERAFGVCDFEVSEGIAEPAPQIRGDIARIYFYMEDAYPGRITLSVQERQMFLKWAGADPPDRWECERSRRIEKIQGNANSFLSEVCK